MRKKYRNRQQAIAIVGDIERRLAQGENLDQLLRGHDVTRNTFLRWRRQYTGRYIRSAYATKAKEKPKVKGKRGFGNEIWKPKAKPVKPEDVKVTVAGHECKPVTGKLLEHKADVPLQTWRNDNLKAENEQLTAKVAELQADNEVLTRAVARLSAAMREVLEMFPGNVEEAGKIVRLISRMRPGGVG